jgi:Protein of unknown function (DUF2971)
MGGALPGSVFHYTSHQSLYNIIHTRELWAHDARLTNDSREIEYASGLMVRAINELETWQGFGSFIAPAFDFLKDPFDPFRMRHHDGYLVVASFSEEPNLLSQWRAYAPANGYSIGFSTKDLMYHAKAAGFKFGKVEYDLGRAVSFFKRKLKAFMQSKVIQKNAGSETNYDLIEDFVKFLMSTMPLVKHPSFEEEKEWRAYCYADTPDAIKFHAVGKSLVPYIPILLSESGTMHMLKELIVGPSFDQHMLCRWTADYLRLNKYAVRHNDQGEGVRIYVSGTPFRSK